jgi:hypothetical protein
LDKNHYKCEWFLHLGGTDVGGASHFDAHDEVAVQAVGAHERVAGAAVMYINLRLRLLRLHLDRLLTDNVT